MEIVIDARDLPPPKPFERTMEALDSLPPNGTLILWIHRHPEPLLRVLAQNGYCWTQGNGPEGCFEFRIRH